MFGYRITDAVDYYRRRGEARGAVREVRSRSPEKFRWRAAVSVVSQVAGGLRGAERMRVEEPIRELVLDLDSALLQREVVLDARRHRVDLDRGEILPRHTIGELRRAAFLIGADVQRIDRYVRLPEGFEGAIDTGAVVIVARTIADFHRRRAQKLSFAAGRFDDSAAKAADTATSRAARDFDEARRWTALGRVLLGERPLEEA